MIESHAHGSIVELRLDRPPANALTSEVLEAMADRVDDALAGGASALILSSTGRAFCAGLDLREVPTLDREGQNRLLRALNRCIGTLYGCPVPTVVAVNGHAIAGGFILPLCFDARLRADTRFLVGLTEVQVGVPYPVAAIEVAKAELAPDLCRRLVLFGDTCDVAELDGIFDSVVPEADLRGEALARAEQLSSLPAHTYAVVKQQTRATTLATIRQAVEDGDPLSSRWLSEETRERARQQLEANRK